MRIPLIGVYQNTIQDIFNYLKNPQDKSAEIESSAAKLKILGRVLSIDIVIGFVFVAIMIALAELGWYDNDNHAADDFLKNFPTWAILLLMVLAIPFLEEVVFRYGLRFKLGWFTFLYALIIIIAVGYTFYLLPLYLAIFLLLVLTSPLILLLFKYDQCKAYLKNTWHRHYGWVYYSIAILFGIVHIFNYTDFNYGSAAILLVPILVGPQIIGGLLIGYMRVRFGFFWGFGLHAGSNAFLVIIVLLFMPEFEEKLNETNDQFTIKIEQNMKLVEDEKLSHIQTDTIAFTNTRLTDIILSLLDKNNSVVDFTGSKHKNTSLNISFKNFAQNPDIFQSRGIILDQLQALYQFEIVADTVLLDFWSLDIENRELLSSAVAVTKDINTSTFMNGSENLTFENVTLEELLRHISNEFKIGIVSEKSYHDEGRYALVLPKNVEQAKVVLRTKYGIKITTSKQSSDMTKVRFKKA